MNKLPINIDDLINGSTIEWERIEFKEGWNPESIIHEICAFANDISNWGGGYIILGIEDKDGRPVLPPKGLELDQIDAIQKKMVELGAKITPNYYPIAVPYQFQEKNILVIWVSGGENRPYEVPQKLGSKEDTRKAHYVRRLSSSKMANTEERRQLLELAAKIPFDDRVNQQAPIDDIKRYLIIDFLKSIGSSLVEEAKDMEFIDLCKQLQIVRGDATYLYPVNVGLLMFTEDPSKYFRGAKIEIVEYKDEVGDEFEESIFNGALNFQLKNALKYIKSNLIKEKVIKVPNQDESLRFYNYPFAAIEEALANSVFHRGYEDHSTIQISVRYDRIEIQSFPGALAPISNETLATGKVIVQRHRNRRIGDFLKELKLTEGRGTGFPKIKKSLKLNGSPEPTFETDPERTFFLTTIYMHENFVEKLEGIDLSVSSNITLKILAFCQEGKSSKEIYDHLDMSYGSRSYNKYIKPLLEGFLEYTIPDSPKSSKQKYITTSVGRTYLAQNNV
jgi:ATP-dependent DNA helicase RecG